MTKTAILTIILFLVTISTTANTQKHKGNKDPYTIDVKYKNLKDNINFGTSAKRIWAIKEIVKEKKYFDLIRLILQNEENISVVTEAINACSKLKLKEYAHIIQDKLGIQNELDFYIIEALGNLKYKKAEDLIISFVDKKQNRIVTLTAIQTIGKIKSVKALPKLYNHFNETKDYQSKYEIINAVKLIENKNSLDFLNEIINDKNYEANLRANAIIAIAKCGGELGLIENYSKDNDITIAVASINAMSFINTTTTEEKSRMFNIAYNSLKKDEDKMRLAALNVISSITLSPENRQSAIDITQYIVYNDENKTVRQKAIETLSSIGNDYAKKIWEKELIKKNNPNIQLAIIKSIDKLNKDNALKLLNTAFENASSPIVKKKVIEKYFQIDSDKAINFINTYIMKSNAKLPLKLYSIMLIYKAEDNSNRIQSLKAELKNPNIHIRRYAYNYLLQIDKQKTKEIVFNTLKTEDNPDVILYLLQVFYQRKLTDSLPLLKEKLVKSDNIRIKKESQKLIKYLEALS